MWILRNHKTEPFCWGLWILACYHNSCRSSPNFLKKERSAMSLLHCLPAQANSVISLSILYYPSSDFIVFYPFNSIATACGCEWGEGASSAPGDWLCYLCAGAAAAPFVPCYSAASALARGCSGGISDRQEEDSECHRQGFILPGAWVVVECLSVLVFLLPAQSGTSHCTSFQGEGNIKGYTCSQLLQIGCIGSTVFRISICIFTVLVILLHVQVP